ncbi:hypothetical protein Tco_0328387 [Tanacetum coccineum]
MAKAEQAHARPHRVPYLMEQINGLTQIDGANWEKQLHLKEEKITTPSIFKIAVDILKQTNFFRAFTASSTIPAIYIQQFCYTIRFDSKARSFQCQLDEQWFNLNQDTLRDALQITPVDKTRAFSSPPTPDTLLNLSNKLGYPKEEICTWSISPTNDMFQPWRALATIINLCLTGKTSGFERPRAPVLQILWGIVNRAHIDYAERMWEEFTQSIHTFTEDKRKLDNNILLGRRKQLLFLFPSIKVFTKLIIFHLQRLEKSSTKTHSPQHLPTEEPVLAKPSVEDTDEANYRKREPDTGKLQFKHHYRGAEEKGKEKVRKEQSAHVLLNLQTPKKKKLDRTYIFQRRSQLPTLTAVLKKPLRYMPEAQIIWQ